MPTKKLTDQELEGIASSIAIPPCPSILIELAAEVRSDNPDFRRVEQLVLKDVGLSATLLKTINSPYYGLQTKVVTVKQALNMLGLATLSQTVAASVLKNTIAIKDKVSMERFWDASTKIAVCAAFLAKQLPGIRSDDAYTFGLFQNCGIPLLMQKYSTYKQTLGLGNDTENRNFTQIEDNAHGTDHATIAYMLTKTWGMPEPFTTAIRFHHEYQILSEENAKVSPASRSLIAIGLLAEHMVNRDSSLGYSKEWTMGGEAALAYLKVTKVEFEEFFLEITDRLA